MARQTINFLTDSQVSVSVEIRGEADAYDITMLFHPSGEPHQAKCQDVEEVADLIVAPVVAHMDAHFTRVMKITIRHDRHPVTYRDLGRFGAPIYPMP